MFIQHSTRILRLIAIYALFTSVAIKPAFANWSPEYDGGLLTTPAPIVNSQFDIIRPANSDTAAENTFFDGVKGKATEIVKNALAMIGVRYRWGGNTPHSGLDCSGFVRYVFQDTVGFDLPRTANEMSHYGEKITKNELQPGDLVFFHTMRRKRFSHVGIYIGDNKFVHSPSTGSTIRVDYLTNGYWSKRFSGARRLDLFS